MGAPRRSLRRACASPWCGAAGSATASSPGLVDVEVGGADAHARQQLLERDLEQLADATGVRGEHAGEAGDDLTGLRGFELGDDVAVGVGVAAGVGGDER